MTAARPHGLTASRPHGRARWPNSHPIFACASWRRGCCVHVIGHPVGVRIAYVTESFPPDVNGVAITATRVAEHLTLRGHEPVVICPEPSRSAPSLDSSLGYPIVRVPAVGLPIYPGFRSAC